MIPVDMTHPAEVLAPSVAAPATHGVDPPAMDAVRAQSSGVDAMGIPGVSSSQYTMSVTFRADQSWTPTVDAKLLPEVGQHFSTLAQGVTFYTEYANAGGFDVRLSTMKRDRDGAIIMRYLVCSRQGVRGGGKRIVNQDGKAGGAINKQRRRRVSKRVECNAKICIRKDHTGEFVVSIFVAEHNHSLCTEASKQNVVHDPLAEVNYLVGIPRLQPTLPVAVILTGKGLDMAHRKDPRISVAYALGPRLLNGPSLLRMDGTLPIRNRNGGVVRMSDVIWSDTCVEGFYRAALASIPKPYHIISLTGTAHSPWWFHHCADRRLAATREATPAAAAPKASRTAVEGASLYDRRLNFEDHAEARDVPTVVGVDGENGWPGALLFDR
nr:protein FAR1-RELATED SEQUENCE 5-like [Ipomoea batatas]